MSEEETQADVPLRCCRAGGTSKGPRSAPPRVLSVFTDYHLSRRPHAVNRVAAAAPQPELLEMARAKRGSRAAAHNAVFPSRE